MGQTTGGLSASAKDVTGKKSLDRLRLRCESIVTAAPSEIGGPERNLEPAMSIMASRKEGVEQRCGASALNLLLWLADPEIAPGYRAQQLPKGLISPLGESAQA